MRELRLMITYSSFTDWINHCLACMGGCFGCCTKVKSILGVDEPSKGLIVEGQTVKKTYISDDFWSTSTYDLDSSALQSALQSQRSYSSISIPNQSLGYTGAASSTTENAEFINHGLLYWNKLRLEWVGNKKPGSLRRVKSRLSWNVTYESLLVTNKRFPRPVPLSEMVEFLGDVWEQEGLYE